ncbi:protein lin-52 homolog isoform X3 [Salmo salar]|nr:protein lin-52 homolog isoform X3 [Salmo salar]
MAELESEDIEMLKELGSLTTANLMEKVKGLQNLAYQLGLEEWLTGVWLAPLACAWRGEAASSRLLPFYTRGGQDDVTMTPRSPTPNAREMTRGKFLNILERPKK